MRRGDQHVESIEQVSFQLLHLGKKRKNRHDEVHFNFKIMEEQLHYTRLVPLTYSIPAARLGGK